MLVFNSLALAPLLATALSIALALYSYQIKAGIGRVRGTILFTSLVLYTAGAAAELCSTDVSTALLFVKFEYIGIALAAPCWLSLILGFAGYDKLLNRNLMRSIFIIPGMTIIIAISPLMMPWLYESAYMNVSNGFSLLKIVPGPWYWINTVYNILILSIGTIILVFMFIRSEVLFKRQIALMLIGSLVPFIAFILNISGLRPIPNLDLTPFALIITGLSIIPAISRYHFMDILPVAHKTVLEGIPIGVIVLDTKDRIREINPAAERIIAATSEAVLGKPAEAVIVGWDTMMQGLCNPKEQNEFHWGAGEEREVYQICKIPLEEIAGFPSGSIILFTNITARIRAEAQEKRRTSQLLTLLDTLPGYAYYKDTSGIYITANRAYCELLGVEGPIEGRRDTDIIPPELLKSIGERDMLILSGEREETQYELKVRTPDGYIDISGRIVPYRDEQGKIAGLIGLGYDITSRKAEEARVKEYASIIEMRNKELTRLHAEMENVNRFLDAQVHERTREVEALLIQKDHFIGQLGHDLRTPLIPLVGLIPFLIEQEKDPDIVRLLSQMKISIDVMQNTVEQVIHLARLNSMYSITDRVTYDLINITGKVTDDLMDEAKEAGISIYSDIPKGYMVSLSPVHAHTIFRHVISNAIRFNKTGGSVWIGAHSDNEHQLEKKPGESSGLITELSQNTVTVVIRDNGVGIAEQDITRIFDEFYQVDQSRQNLQAKGLGLAIVRRMVTLNHGKIWAESDGLGKGSTFYIRFIRV
jgi:PAS domain S-box-containing protein